MKNKKLLKTFTILLLLITVSFTAFAHPGRTDKNGGHYDSKTGEYHYHNSGSSSNASSKNSSKEVYATEINILNAPKIMTVGDIANLEVTVYPQDATDNEIFWQSSNTSVISISREGVLNAVGVGMATMYASTQMGIYTTKNIIVCENESDVVVNLQINNPIMEVNGIESEIDIGRGTKPVLINGRTLVPIRAIIEALGGTVDWEESTQSVILSMGDDIIRLVIDNHVGYLNNQTEILDVAPTTINGRTMIPIRFIAEGFKLNVDWDDKTQRVVIVKNYK